MRTISHWNIFCITGPLWGESIGHRKQINHRFPKLSYHVKHILLSCCDTIYWSVLFGCCDAIYWRRDMILVTPVTVDFKNVVADGLTRIWCQRICIHHIEIWLSELFVNVSPWLYTALDIVLTYAASIMIQRSIDNTEKTGFVMMSAQSPLIVSAVVITTTSSVTKWRQRWHCHRDYTWDSVNGNRQVRLWSHKRHPIARP